MKKSKIIIVISLCLVIALFVSSYLVYNSLFPLAPPIEVPDRNQIISVTYILPDGTITENEYDMDFAPKVDVLAYLEHARPTRIMSVNDSPDVADYYTISYVCVEKTYTYYLYESNGKNYAEIPYVGVYEV